MVKEPAELFGWVSPLHINDTLKELFLDKIFTVADLSKLLGVSRQMVYNYLKGKNTIDIENVYKICDAYNLPLQLFIGSKEIWELKKEISKLEFIIKNILSEKWLKEKKTNPPDNIYDFPEVKAQEIMYQIESMPGVGIELGKAMKINIKNKKTTKEG